MHVPVAGAVDVSANVQIVGSQPNEAGNGGQFAAIRVRADHLIFKTKRNNSTAVESRLAVGLFVLLNGNIVISINI